MGGKEQRVKACEAMAGIGDVVGRNICPEQQIACRHGEEKMGPKSSR